MQVLGFSSDFKEYRFWSLENNRVIVSRSVVFDKTSTRNMFYRSFPTYQTVLNQVQRQEMVSLIDSDRPKSK